MGRLKEFLFVFVLLLFIPNVHSEVWSKKQNAWLMDKDRNGVLSFTEFSLKCERWFSKLDQDADGNLTSAELGKQEELIKEKKFTRMADRLDRNDDNKIDRKEFSHNKGVPKNRFRPRDISMLGASSKERREISEAIFETIDKDDNGFLSTNELAEGEKVGPRVARNLKFQMLDTDSNNKISRGEFLAPLKKRFEEADKNADDVLDRRELKSSFRKRKKGNRLSRKRNKSWKDKPIMHKEKKTK